MRTEHIGDAVERISDISAEELTELMELATDGLGKPWNHPWRIAFRDRFTEEVACRLLAAYRANQERPR